MEGDRPSNGHCENSEGLLKLERFDGRHWASLSCFRFL